jgi:hypothetical protein
VLAARLVVDYANIVPYPAGGFVYTGSGECDHKFRRGGGLRQKGGFFGHASIFCTHQQANRSDNGKHHQFEERGNVHHRVRRAKLFVERQAFRGAPSFSWSAKLFVERQAFRGAPSFFPCVNCDVVTSNSSRLTQGLLKGVLSSSLALFEGHPASVAR